MAVASRGCLKGRCAILRRQTKTYQIDPKGSWALQWVWNLVSSNNRCRNGLGIFWEEKILSPTLTRPLNHDIFLRKQGSNHSELVPQAAEELTYSFRKHSTKQLFVWELAQTFWEKMFRRITLIYKSSRMNFSSEVPHKGFLQNQTVLSNAECCMCARGLSTKGSLRELVLG